MTDEPTKAAIERVYEQASHFANAFDQPVDRLVHAFARHLDQVSETAKVCAQSAIADAERYRLLQPFILPDPEPDVLAELLGSDFELTWAGHEASADDLRTELAKRGYAITKTGEAGQ